MTGAVTLPTAAALMAEASQRTGGLADFGPPAFLDGLDVFLRSMRDDDGFTAEGVAQTAEEFVGRLVNRLRIEDWYRAHPEIEEERPERPLLITGLPRTGTTALAYILSIEPAFRRLRSWEQGSPAPPPILEEEANDPRRLAMEARLEALRTSGSEHMTMHLTELDATAEDVPLLGLAFKPQSFTTPTFSYHAWWRESDMTPAYAYQRRVAKLLQSRRPPNRWLFKAPHYVFHLEAVVAAYPDARFLITHRDPVKTIPSWGSVLISRYPPGSLEKVGGAAALGARFAEHQAIGMRRMMEARARIGEHRFLDVHHHDFVRDPIRELARIYDFTGLPLTSATRQAMLDWSQKNRPGARGEHIYRAAQFGLSEADLRKQFSFYTDAYGVKLEQVSEAA